MTNDKPLTDEELTAIETRLSKITPGPWCWDYISNKNNGFIVGFAMDESESPLRGCIDEVDEICDTVIVGEREAATVNYDDAKFIAAAPDDMASLIAEVRRLRADAELREGLCVDCYRGEKEDAGLTPVDEHPKFYLNACAICGH